MSTEADAQKAAADEAQRAGSEGLTAKWADVAVREMMTAASVDDARQKALLVLQAFEKESMDAKQQDQSAAVHAEQERRSASELQLLQQQVGVLCKENQILKRAVAIQHEKQKEHQAQNEENASLRQALAQYQEQVHKLEVANYALNLHLRQANDAVNHAALSGRFHPDVF
ncbi:hypothetical protein CLOM_g15593 [Closterium sp. NIES-68]|nr:hypothetical protein CLOM_g15593 [Closterium sp. NIES-68]GJP79563.1 hypothetical protein CLOP_g9784 [Closterium sp. NIES-67]